MIIKVIKNYVVVGLKGCILFVYMIYVYVLSIGVVFKMLFLVLRL